MSSRYGKLWEHDELVLALYLYCQIPFGQAHSRSEEVQQLAALLERTPASVARKLGNFAAFDPILSARGVGGLPHGGKGDRKTWNEFHDDWNSLTTEAQKLLALRNAPRVEADTNEPPIFSIPTVGSEQMVSAKARLHQAFFRRAVLSSYRHACCICGLDLGVLLVAGHIIPWAADEHKRADPQNGLCLCALHDKAFDRGLMTVGPDLAVRLSRRVQTSMQPFVVSGLVSFEGHKISTPERFAPKPEYLEWHAQNIFVS